MVIVCARVLVLFLLKMLLAALAASSEGMTKPGCLSECGNLRVPYPFGIGTECARDEGFAIDCNNTDGTMIPYLGHGNLQILNISLPTGELQVNTYMAYDCYVKPRTYQRNFAPQAGGGRGTAYAELGGRGTYLFSSARNKFTAIGCDTLAYIGGDENITAYKSGCVSSCKDKASVVEGSCSGQGCCQTSIPKGLSDFNVTFGNGSNHSEFHDFSPCSYAFLADAGWFNFTTADLNLTILNGEAPVVRTWLDWAIRRPTTCRKAVSSEDYACRSMNSDCYEAPNGSGYLCNCSKGYEGNPYLDDGCTDIDECDPKLRKQYPCYGHCTNLPGTYRCTCPHGQSGNATLNTCRDNFPLAAKLATGISGGLVLLIVASFFTLLRYQKIKHLQERDDFFRKNGGLKLYEEMRSRQVDTIQIFTMKDLEKATDNFDKGRVIGVGGHGTVYKGILEDRRIVAIKKSKILNETQKEEFVNEIIILSQINHKNVVRLLGCCLEADVPMLVYEFVSHGTLFNLIHDKESRPSRISLVTRLRIAAESAEALAYLHSSTIRSIIHGDVKSANILLDDKFMAKVSDFGASQLAPMDEKEFVDFVQGTFGYLDPESLQTRCLTEKSDVYSFGVVLLELLTRQKATDHSRGNLASRFISMMNEHRLQDIIDEEILEEGDLELCLDVADLAMQCLSVKGAERPMMKEVADRLQSLRRFKQHPWGPNNIPEEFESLLSKPIAYTKADPSQNLEITMPFDTERAR